MTEQSSSIQFAKSYHLLQSAMIAAIAIFCFMGSTIVNGYIIDGNGLMLGRDFLNMWHYGIAAFSENPAAFTMRALIRWSLNTQIKIGRTHPTSCSLLRRSACLGIMQHLP